MKHLKVLKVKTTENPADVFTKALSAELRNKSCRELQHEFR